LLEAAASVYFDMWGRRYAARHHAERAAALQQLKNQ
jgi:hypothetical protein